MPRLIQPAGERASARPPQARALQLAVQRLLPAHSSAPQGSWGRITRSHGGGRSFLLPVSERASATSANAERYGHRFDRRGGKRPRTNHGAASAGTNGGVHRERVDRAAACDDRSAGECGVVNECARAAHGNRTTQTSSSSLRLSTTAGAELGRPGRPAISAGRSRSGTGDDTYPSLGCHWSSWSGLGRGGRFQERQPAVRLLPPPRSALSRVEGEVS